MSELYIYREDDIIVISEDEIDKQEVQQEVQQDVHNEDQHKVQDTVQHKGD